MGSPFSCISEAVEPSCLLLTTLLPYCSLRSESSAHLSVIRDLCVHTCITWSFPLPCPQRPPTAGQPGSKASGSRLFSISLYLAGSPVVIQARCGLPSPQGLLPGLVHAALELNTQRVLAGSLLLPWMPKLGLLFTMAK